MQFPIGSIYPTREGAHWISVQKFAALYACMAAVAIPLMAQTSGSNGSHDPSRMLEDNGKLYVYSTGGGMKSSPDGLAWSDGAAPTWNKNLLSNNQGIWAPDAIKMDGVFYLYGALWNESEKSSVLALLTSPTLNPSSPAYKWTDRGAVVTCPAGVTRSCIDAGPFLDKDGKPWIVWGGGYPFSTTSNSIWVTPLDRATGLPLASDPGYRPPDNPGYPVEQGHKEGPYIHYHGGYYYLWWQTGGCCNGASSTYTMHVARALAVTGPYTGDQVFYASQKNLEINGPGHIGIITCHGQDYFSYHYYPASGYSVIGLNTLTWNASGWPVAGPQTTKGLQLPCGDASTSSLEPKAVESNPLQMRSGRFGREVRSDAEGALEIRDPAGKLLRNMHLETGWNRISEDDLGAGLNIIRALTAKGAASALVLKGGR